MSKHYKHLSKEERDRLAILKGQGQSIRAIAAQLGRSPSTVSRELHRNTDHGTSDAHLPHQAQAKADLRWKQSHRRPRLKSSFLRHHVRVNLKRGWSPEQIAGRLRHEEKEAEPGWVYGRNDGSSRWSGQAGRHNRSNKCSDGLIGRHSRRPLMVRHIVVGFIVRTLLPSHALSAIQGLDRPPCLRLGGNSSVVGHQQRGHIQGAPGA